MLNVAKVIYGTALVFLSSLVLVSCSEENSRLVHDYTVPPSVRPLSIGEISVVDRHVSIAPESIGEIALGQEFVLKCVTSGGVKEFLEYHWESSGGEFKSYHDFSDAVWRAPDTAGQFFVSVDASDGVDSLRDSVLFDVKRVGPRLTIKDATFDFGFAPQESKISHTFSLYSTGDDSLKILKIVAGCGCVSSLLDDNRLTPGFMTEVEIAFLTKLYKNRIHKRPLILTNEGLPHKSVSIMAHVVERPDSTYPIRISPYRIDISQSTEEMQDHASFMITNVSDEDINIKVIDFPDALILVEFPLTVPAGKARQGFITLKSEAINIEFEKSITIELNDSTGSHFTIPVVRTVH